MDAQRIDILTREISKHFKHTARGHCARVDFLPRDEASAICHQFRQQQPESGFKTYLLANGHRSAGDDFTITTDHAIEIRNRKQESLCLFVPMDIVDATV